MLRALQVALPTVPIIEAAPAPILAPLPAAPAVDALQTERAEIRADLPFMRHYAANFDDGPSFAEIAAMEARLNELDEMLCFEVDPIYDAPSLRAA
jgi:hypothetical protein